MPKHTHTHTQDEQWRDIPGWEGHYQVSSQGRVRSLDRTTTSKVGIEMRFRGRPLKGVLDTFGYPIVSLASPSTGRVRHQIHRLVLEAFVGPCPEGMEACHWDDNPENNNLENLRWASHADNMADKSRNWTVCRRGHEITDDNVYTHPDGSRRCKTCKNAHSKEWSKKNYVPKPPKPEKTHCDNGHPLVSRNLSQYRLKRGVKTCLACERARVHVRRNKEMKPYFKKVADSYYATII